MVYGQLNPLLAEPLPLPADAAELMARLHGELLDRAAKLAGDDWAGRATLLAACGQCRDLRVKFGGGGIDSFFAEVLEGTALTALMASAGPRITTTELAVLRGFAARRNETRIAGKYRERLAHAAGRILADATAPWTPEELPLAETLLTEIAWIDELADPATVFPPNARPAQLLALVRQRVAETAPAARRARLPAVLDRIAARMAEPDPEVVRIRAALGADAVAIKDAVDPSAVPLAASPALAGALKQESAAFLNASRSAIEVLGSLTTELPVGLVLGETDQRWGV
jgi:hypothetical protein